MRRAHVLTSSAKRPEEMNDSQANWRLQQLGGILYEAKLEFLGKVDDLVKEALSVANVEANGVHPSDAEELLCQAHKLAQIGIDAANGGMDTVVTGLDLAYRAFRVERQGKAMGP